MAPLLDMDQLAAHLGVKRSWVKDKVAARQIPFTKVGKHVRFTEEHVAQIVAMGEQSAITTPPRLTVVRRGHPPAGPSTPPPPPAPPRREQVA